ncbi:MAG: cobalt transporter CbiM [Candidatus Electrothrix sp. AS4_5]|nr:cobalt transporter CbiM [Candidatus Electrothrix gigas]MCI5189041.1 cobalt transporter CbiM [Candidatus Electrothrix gigas]
MHISEGVLSTPILIGGGVLTVLGLSIGLKKIDYDRVMEVSILASTFFVASLIHVPLGPGSVHLILNGLLGMVLGWASFPAIFIALLLQAFFFQYGGLVVLGVNTFNMAAPAVLCFYLFGPLVSPLVKDPQRRALAGFAGGFFSVFFSGILMSSALALSDSGFFSIAQMVVAAHLPVMIIEGFITMFTVSFLAKIKPEILQSYRSVDKLVQI